METKTPDTSAQPEKVDRLADTFYVLLSSYNKRRGRVLDPEQVVRLVEAFEEISEMNQRLTDENKQLRRELEERKGRWRINKKIAT